MKNNNRKHFITVFSAYSDNIFKRLVGYAQNTKRGYILRIYPDNNSLSPLSWYKEEQTFSSICQAEKTFRKLAFEYGYRESIATKTISVGGKDGVQ